MAKVENAWRALAGAMGYPNTGEVVEIPDLNKVLFDPVRYRWDEGKFNEWIRKHFKKLPLMPEKLYPEWRFNHQVEDDGSGFTFEGRNSFICVYAKLKREGLWDEVNTIRWVGKTGEIAFFPHRGSEGFRQFIIKNGYGDWWLASKDCHWGLRSRFSGAQLHFRGYAGANDPTNAHIDLHNPGDPEKGGTSGSVMELPDAIAHVHEDLWRRSHSHRWWFLRTALINQGVDIPVVH